MRFSSVRNSCVVMLLCAVAGAQQAGAPKWVAAWMAAPCAFAEAEPRHDQAELKAETVRQIVHLTAGGLAVRVRLSNTFGTTPLVVDVVRVAPAMAEGEIDPKLSVALTQGGKAQIVVPAGKSVLTDAANLATTAGTDLAVSFYVAGKVEAPAVHYTALQTSYTAAGDQTAEAKMKTADKTTLRMIVMGVDVASRTTPYAVVGIGSSTTDGAHSSMDKNRRWTDDLWRRLEKERGAAAPSVVNAGISGNRVLHNGRGDWGPIFGDAATVRFNRDALAQSGVKYVIAFEGGNDIRMPGAGAVPLEDTVSGQQLIAAFQLMAKAAHDRGAKFLAGTITPSEGSEKNRIESPLWEKTRTTFNAWVVSAKEIDGFVDFAAAIQDPQHPSRILAKYDSGDHLHPNDAGYQAMADSFDLKLFQ